VSANRKYRQRTGEAKVCRNDIAELSELSKSDDICDRLVAAELLCPCHVRRREPMAWEALFRLLEDGHPKVRLAAWHTLEDGGDIGDSALVPIAERVLVYEKSGLIRRLAGEVVRRKEELARHTHMAEALYRSERGKCDFCGSEKVPVESDYSTMIPTSALPRPAKICAGCRRA
jgi:hypothetical protein